MDRDEHDEILRTLLRIPVKQDIINDDLRECHRQHLATSRRQEGINERLTAAIERLDISVARLGARTARGCRQGDTGTDA